MLLALWYSLHGYVKIKISGFSAERFVNMAAFRGIYFWEVVREGASVTMKAAGGSMELLEACAEKTANHCLGLRSDGSVVATGDNGYWQCEMPETSDIVAIDAGFYHNVFLTSDGQVLAFGNDGSGQCIIRDDKIFR